MDLKKGPDIRVRLAPSPSGFLHIGTARTAMFNWLFARHHRAVFVLRIEDTDVERSEKRFEDDIVDGLKWLGLEWDEFYRQSDRLPIYSTYIKSLLESGKAFWCYHTPEELEAERGAQAANKEAPRHVCSHKNAETSHRAPGSKGVIRLAVDEKIDRKIVVDDLIRGKVEFDARLIGDFAIAKSPEQPLFHIAVVIDDYEMKISHVIRGEDHLSNTPKHILIQEALGFNVPCHAHIPMILAPDRSKLSKRHGATSIAEYRGLGYLPEAIANYLGLLGFTPPGNKEVLSLPELADLFDISKVHHAGAIFDLRKLDWINGEHIKNKSDKELTTLLAPYVESKFGGVDDEYLMSVVPLAKERMKKLSDISEYGYFFGEPSYDSGLLQWKERSISEVKDSLARTRLIIESKGTESREELRIALDEMGKQTGDRGLVYWPFRVALTGEKSSPDPVEIAFVLGRERVLKRIDVALDMI